ncbi:MAG: DNA-directed RNA polymerase subunit beta [Oscillospiraceae bacterium]|nr:DNA-directed RNA polymerase subunit beta [Oscillospiraceae bacterium]
MVKMKPTMLGTTERMNFAKINEVLDMPNLIEVQKSSYKWFIEEGIKEVFRDTGAIEDHTGTLALEFVDYHMEEQTKYSVKECKIRDVTYAAPLKVTIRLLNKETGEIKQQEKFMGDFPKMTESGTFIINGAERVVVSQLVRSPGAYFKLDRDKTGKELYSGTVMPNRGAWLEYETDINDRFYVRIDKNRKLPVTTFLRALGLSSDRQIRELFGEEMLIEATLLKDTTTNREEGLLETYRKLRPGEPPTVENSEQHLRNLFFDPRRYDLSRFGRYKFNKKLSLADRIVGKIAADNVVSELTGEILLEKGQEISEEMAELFEEQGVNSVYVEVEDNRENKITVKVLSNGMVDSKKLTGLDLTEEGINEKVSFKVLQQLIEEADGDKDALRELMISNREILIPKNITLDDIFASVNYVTCLSHGVGDFDDIDHLGNRRIRSVGELLQAQFRTGIVRMERTIRERMDTQDRDTVTPESLINIKPLVAIIKEFFGSSQLSQFMDQTNPLAELTHKRRLSALGPGGLSRDRAGFEVRDVHYSHYGRMCPIETPEGPNIGLISYLATFARINEYGFVEAPYRRVDSRTGEVTKDVVYMTADVEDKYIVAQANEPLDENNRFVHERVNARYRDQILEASRDEVQFMDVSPKMVISVATSMIPFLENDDANRALMGSNMQRQAVPLLRTEAPIVATGMDYKAGYDSGVVVIAQNDGVVEKVSADKIVIKTGAASRDEYDIVKFMRSNQGTCINQKPIVSEGEFIKKGQVIADGPSTDHGEISLGKNVLVGYMTWEGYNYEDAVLINERVVSGDVFTSIHIEEYEIEARETKLGPEEITREVPSVGEDAIKDLDERGIIRIGAEVTSGDILVGKVSPKGETELSPEEKLLRAIFGEKAGDVRDTSLKVPHGEYGTVVDVKVFTPENSDEIKPGVLEVVRVYIAQKRKISVGDKMAGRHGNKGVVSRILPQEDMPFLADGTPLDLVLNPLGVPSRMNIGQILEVHLGYAAKALGFKVMTPVFDGAKESDIFELLREANLPETGKTQLYDGRTGEPFDNPVTVGYTYFLKLHHLVDDKMHARSIGPYSLVTQQPLGGKAQFGGQRFGEMEVWALEAYGAAYTLQEILTVKSDDMVGRVKTYESIFKGEDIPQAGIPESFRVLIKEMQSLALDVKVIDGEGNELDLKRGYDDDEPRADFAGDLITEFNEDERDMGGFMISDDPENDFALDDDSTGYSFSSSDPDMDE